MKGGRFLILEGGFLLSLVVAPLFFGSVYPWASLSLCALLFFLLLLDPAAISEYHSLPRLFKGGILCVFLVLLLEWRIFSLNRYLTSCELVKWIAFTAGFLLVRRLPHSSLVRLGVAFVAMGVLEAVYGLFQIGSGREAVLWKSKESYLGFVTGTYFNRNHLAGLLELSLGMHLGLWLWCFREKKFLASVFLSVLFLISATAFLKTGSRTGVVSLAASFLLFVSFLGLKEKKPIVLFLSLLLLVVVAVSWVGGETLALRFGELSENQDSLQGRLAVWRDAVVLLRDRPWFGIGLGNFSWAFPRYQSSALILGWSHAHNDYLELAIEIGVPFFGVLMVSFASLWVGCVRKLFFSPSHISPIVWGGLISLTSLSLHGLADFNWAIPANAWLFILLWGMTLRLLELSGSGTGIRG